MFKFGLDKEEIDESEQCDMCKCSDCGWTGKIDECNSYEDQESWEIPLTYSVFECPKCEDGGCIDDFFFSDKKLRNRIVK